MSFSAFVTTVAFMPHVGRYAEFGNGNLLINIIDAQGLQKFFRSNPDQLRHLLFVLFSGSSMQGHQALLFKEQSWENQKQTAFPTCQIEK